MKPTIAERVRSGFRIASIADHVRGAPDQNFAHLARG
jgi:hypothetical protein